MNFFISWSFSDPHYASFMPGVNLLVSPSGVSQSWNISHFQVQPERYIIDSGAFALMNHESEWSQKKVFSIQSNMLNGVTVPTWVGHFDQPIPPSCESHSAVYQRIETTLVQAYEFNNLFAKAKFPQHVKKLGVIQGNSFESVRFCARELSRLEFDLYGIGSLVPLFNTQTIMERIMGALEIVGPRLHVFGVSSLEVIEQLIRLKVESCDSSRPIKSAFYGDVFYSNPFRTFLVPTARRIQASEVLEEPLPCMCPVCSKNPWDIMASGSKKETHLRAIQNYFHLRAEIEAMTGNAGL